MTFEQALAAWIVGSSIVSAAFAMFAIVVAISLHMEDAEARERSRRGARLDAGMDGVDSARSEDPDRAASLRVFRGDGWVSANEWGRGR